MLSTPNFFKNIQREVFFTLGVILYCRKASRASCGVLLEGGNPPKYDLNSLMLGETRAAWSCVITSLSDLRVCLASPWECHPAIQEDWGFLLNRGATGEVGGGACDLMQPHFVSFLCLHNEQIPETSELGRARRLGSQCCVHTRARAGGGQLQDSTVWSSGSWRLFFFRNLA